MDTAGAHTPEPYLQVRDLTKTFGRFVALKEISLDVMEGEFVCFLGPSGCGKTTFLRAIAGLDIQTSGTIEQAGRDISALPPSERDFGIVFQSYALFPNLTAQKNIAFGLENSGRKRAEVDARVSELLALVGLPDQGPKYPAQLSGGQQQRIALARAIATSPGLLLLDEPLSALDARVRVHLRHEIKDLQARLGVTTIMVTHDQEEALTMADRIVVMNHGVIEQVGTPQEIYGEPQSLFVADFIGEMNQVEGVTAGADGFRLGSVTFSCPDHGLAPDVAAILAIRPEDIVPTEGSATGNGVVNAVDLKVEEMEFLGSYWRTRLGGEQLGGATLTADVSINAVRRLSLAKGRNMAVQLPSDSLRVYPAEPEA